MKKNNNNPDQIDIYKNKYYINYLSDHQSGNDFSNHNLQSNIYKNKYYINNRNDYSIDKDYKSLYYKYKKKYLILKTIITGGNILGEAKNQDINGFESIKNKLLEVKNNDDLNILTLRGHGKSLGSVFIVPNNITLLFVVPNKCKSIGMAHSPYIIGKNNKEVSVLNNIYNFFENNMELDLSNSEDFRFYFPGSVVENLRLNSNLIYKFPPRYNYSGIYPLKVGLSKKQNRMETVNKDFNETNFDLNNILKYNDNSFFDLSFNEDNQKIRLYDLLKSKKNPESHYFIVIGACRSTKSSRKYKECLNVSSITTNKGIVTTPNIEPLKQNSMGIGINFNNNHLYLKDELIIEACYSESYLFLKYIYTKLVNKKHLITSNIYCTFLKVLEIAINDETRVNLVNESNFIIVSNYLDYLLNNLKNYLPIEKINNYFNEIEPVELVNIIKNDLSILIVILTLKFNLNFDTNRDILVQLKKENNLSSFLSKIT